jgi:hypothetical protein
VADEWNDELVVRWPELVGATAAEAEAAIRRSHPAVKQISAVPPGYDIPMDFRTDRVWLHVDEDGVVILVPQIG